MKLLPKHCQHNLLQREFHIRYATDSDIAECDRIARQYPAELAFVRKASLQRGVDNKSLHVAIADDRLVGFVLFHRRLDGWQTVYDLAVDKRYAGLTIGRQLLYSVPCPIQLKCKVDNRRANRFYEQIGMQDGGTDGKLRKWHMHTLVIFCAGNNKLHPMVARYAGMGYGCAQNDTPAEWPFFADVEFEPHKQDWQDYMHKIHTWRPVMAMVTDYMHASEKRRLQRQILDLRYAGVQRILVCPKFTEAIEHIPTFCTIALSVPTQSQKFAGWLPDWKDMQHLKNRNVHLLGGSPHAQAALIDRVKLYGGRVVSADGNAMQKAAVSSVIWLDGRWYRNTDGNADNWEFGDYETTLKISARNITQYINKPDDFLSGSTKSINKKRTKARQLELFAL